MLKTSWPHFARLRLVAAAVVAAAVLSACGSSSSTSGGSGSASSPTTTSDSSGASTSSTGTSSTGTSSAVAATGSSSGPSCAPTAPSALPKDPDGVAASLTGAAKTAMAGYPGSVYKSPWANYKPTTKTGWKAGFLTNQPGAYPEDVLNGLKAAAAASGGKISIASSQETSTPNSVTQQIQQMQQLIQQHVNVIFALLASPTGLNAAITAAGKAGIPVFSIAGQSTDKYAINVQANTTQLGYLGAAGLVKSIGTGKTILNVQGIPGVTINTQIMAAANKVFAACKMNIAGSVNGFFVAPLAKTAVLQFLSSHPSTIDGVFQASGMGPGIISAFEQVGRPVPPIADVNPVSASLVYWNQHKSSYHGVAVGESPGRTGKYAVALALALQQGRGIKLTDTPFAPPLITSSNLSQWVEPSWNSSSTVEADGPANAIPITQLVNGYTTKH